MGIKTNNDYLQIIAGGIEQFSDAAVVGVQEQLRCANEQIGVLNSRIYTQENMLKRNHADIKNKNMTIQALKDKIEEINDSDNNRKEIIYLDEEQKKWQLISQILWRQLQTDERKLNCCNKHWNGIQTLKDYYENIDVADGLVGKIYKYKGFDCTGGLKSDDRQLIV